MAENINISFAPNKNADEAQRIADIENYLQTLTERTKFALSTIIENYNETDDNKTSQLKQNIALQSVSDSVGKICGNGTSEQFNDYSTANIDEITRYSHIVGRNNTITGGDYDTIIGKGNTIKNVLSNSEKGYQGTRYGQGSVVTGTSNTTVQSVNTLVSGRNNYVGRSYWNPAIDSMVIGRDNKVYGGMSGSAVIGYNNETPSSEYIDVISLSGSLIAGRDNQVKRGDVYSSFIIGNENKADLSDVYTALKIKKSMSQSVMIGTSNTNECVQGAYTIGHFNHQYSHIAESSTGKGQFAIGVGLKNGMSNNFVMGYYNKKYANGKELDLPFSFGGGTSDDDRKNLIELDWNGNLWIAGNLNEGGGGYVLPIATKSTLGGVMIGDNITVAADGTISVDLSGYLKSADIADWAKQPDKPVYTADEVGAAEEQHTHSKADITDFPAIPTKVSELQNDSGYISEETDPTVPAWAKAETKPTYTASEVGAAAESHNHTVAEITDMPNWAKQPAKPTYTASEVGAATADDISAAINGIEIGGRNYLLNTKTFSSASSTALSGALLSGAASLSEEIYNGLSVRGGAIADSQSIICRYGFKYFGLGDTFTFSFFAKGNVSELRVFFYGETGYVQVAKCVNSQGETNTNADGRCSFTVTDDWKRYWVKWTLKTTGDTSVAKWILMRTYNSVVGQEIYVCGCKLEKGNVNTDWSPDPEDYYSLAERVSALEATALAGGE